jgi:hypothetical protein
MTRGEVRKCCIGNLYFSNVAVWKKQEDGEKMAYR